MKKLSKLLVVLCVATLIVACVIPVSASTFNRKFNGFHAVNKQNPNLYTTDGTSTYANGVVTCNFSKTGAGCWQYITGSTTDIHFQVCIDTSVDPEFDWVGVNVTNDGEAFLGEGTGLSTLIWRTTDSINSRLVKDEDGARWDNVANQELMSGELYTGEAGLEEPYEDYRWGDGQWIDYHIYKSTNNTWKVEVDGKDIIRTPYKNFDKDMDAIFGNGKRLTLSLFLSNASGVVKVRGVDSTAATTTTTTTTKNNATTSTVKKNNSVTTTKNNTPATTTGAAIDSSVSGTDANATTTDVVTDGTVADGTENTTAVATPSDDSSDDTSVTTAVNATNADDNDGKGENGGFPVWATVLIVIVVVAAAGGAVAIWIAKKKK